MITEKSYGNGTGTDMGADGASDGVDGQLGCFTVIERSTVRNIFSQKSIIQTAVSQREGEGEVDAAAAFHKGHEHIVTVL